MFINSHFFFANFRKYCKQFGSFFGGGNKNVDRGNEGEDGTSENDNKLELTKIDKYTKRWGWYIMLYEVAGNDIRLRNEWLAENITVFINHLIFLRETNELKQK